MNQKEIHNYKMKDFFKRAWQDPVGSKVIAGIIIAFFGAMYSLLKGWISNTTTIPNTFKAVFTFKINIWIASGIVLGVLSIVGWINNSINKKKRAPIAPFVDEFTKGKYHKLIWKWRWKWSPKNKFYYITDLNIECPCCNQGLLHFDIPDYSCPKCNTIIPKECINGSPEGVEKQILDEVRTKYSSYKESIGEEPVAIMQN